MVAIFSMAVLDGVGERNVTIVVHRQHNCTALCYCLAGGGVTPEAQPAAGSMTESVLATLIEKVMDRRDSRIANRVRPTAEVLAQSSVAELEAALAATRGEAAVKATAAAASEDISSTQATAREEEGEEEPHEDKGDAPMTAKAARGSELMPFIDIPSQKKTTQLAARKAVEGVVASPSGKRPAERSSGSGTATSGREAKSAVLSARVDRRS